MLLSDFKSIEAAREWLHDAADKDVERELILGLDAHGVPVVSHTLEISGASAACGGSIMSHERQKGAVTAMRLYARARVRDVHTPFVTGWRLYRQPNGGCCCDRSAMKPCQRVPVVELPDLDRLEGWLP